MRSHRWQGFLVLLLLLLGACAPEEINPVDAAVDGRSPPRDTGSSRDGPAVDMPQGDSRPPPVDTGVRPDGEGEDTATTPEVSVPPDVPRCASGVDTDGDGLNDDVECMLGTDPTRRDSDGDGVPDGVEVRYPRVCVAMATGMQRRPPPTCRMDSDCMAGERCVGLDPLNPDTDGDGVPDGAEDTNLDGIIDRSRGETDPRLVDTDGDGVDDSRGSLEICRPSGLATVTQLGLPMAQVQVGHDPRWGTARRAAGTMMRSVVVLEDPAANVAGAVFNLRAMGVDLRAEAARVEAQVVAGLGAGVVPVLVGRAFTTHEMFNAVASLFRVARPAATTATALRDGLVMPLAGVAAPAGGRPVGASMEFLVDVTTTLRTSGLASGTLDVVVTVAPRVEYENDALTTSVRAIDLVNTTGLAPIDRGLGAACQVFRAERAAVVDFLWTVDTSGSMNDDQERLGRTATRFFARLNAAGVDFRVGVVTAGSGMLNIDTPGFRWISGRDPMGARTLCETVTVGTCPGSTTDRVAPYPFSGGSEEPTAAAVLAHDLFRRRTMMGEANPDRRFRDGARIVTFHVTDEPGTNDFGRYFQRSMDPMTGRAWGAVYNAGTLDNIIDYFRRNRMLTFGLLPVRTVPCTALDVYDLPRCVVEGNRGAVIPIATATDAEVDAAMTRIVEAIAGATSQFVLERTPITSTLKVRLRGADVPRSRAEGFDYDAAARAVVFYGTRYRPAMGDEVVVSYRVWQPCPPMGSVCASDRDCCAPQTCTMGRCGLPCRPAGEVCATDLDCCAPNGCVGGRCAPRMMCVPRGGMCRPSETMNDCCPPLVCVDGVCGDAPPCRPTEEACTRNSDCCSGVCTMGRCACRPVSGRCTTPADCCSRFCVEGLCGPG